MVEKKIPPHSTESEQSVLGGILLDKTIISLASKKIKPEVFYNEAHKVIYESMLDIYQEGKEIDLITLMEDLKNKELLEAVGGISYITSLSTIVPTVSNVKYYIDIILEKYTRREVLEEINVICNDLYNSKMEVVTSGIDALKSTVTNNKSIENMYVDASTIKRSKLSNRFISTGFSELDNMLGGGFKCTSLSILTGEPGSGKSTIINQILAGAIQDGYKSFLYSGELPSGDLMFWFNRTVANEHHIVEKTNKKNKKYFDITDYCWDIICKWVKGKFYIYGDDSRANKNNILSVIEHLAIKDDIKLFVLDNLMTFDIGNSNDQYQQQKQLCLSLKQLAKRYGLAIILVAHPRKPAKGEDPSIYDVSGASEIVGSADTVIRTVRPGSKEEEVQDPKILLLKNRWGSVVGTRVRVQFDEYRKRFYTNDSELKRDYGYDENKKFIQVETSNIPF